MKTPDTETLRTAILIGALHVEKDPAAFEFQEPHRPTTFCGGVGCALGWVGAALKALEPEMQVGKDAGTIGDQIIPKAERRDAWYGDKQDGESEFYSRMNTICGDDSWMEDAKVCSRTMRRYANIYHPAPEEVKPTEEKAVVAAAREAVLV